MIKGNDKDTAVKWVKCWKLFIAESRDALATLITLKNFAWKMLFMLVVSLHSSLHMFKTSGVTLNHKGDLKCSTTNAIPLWNLNFHVCRSYIWYTVIYMVWNFV